MTPLRKFAWIIPHHSSPLRLGDLKFAKVKGFAEVTRCWGVSSSPALSTFLSAPIINAPAGISTKTMPMLLVWIFSAAKNVPEDEGKHCHAHGF